MFTLFEMKNGEAMVKLGNSRSTFVHKDEVLFFYFLFSISFFFFCRTTSLELPYMKSIWRHHQSKTSVNVDYNSPRHITLLCKFSLLGFSKHWSIKNRWHPSIYLISLLPASFSLSFTEMYVLLHIYTCMYTYIHINTYLYLCTHSEVCAGPGVSLAESLS